LRIENIINHLVSSVTHEKNLEIFFNELGPVLFVDQF